MGLDVPSKEVEVRSLGGGERTKVLHIITRLILGGAQLNTMITASRLDPGKFDVTLVSGPETGAEGEIIGEVKRRGVRLHILRELVRAISPWRDLAAFVKLYRLVRRQAYAIVHTHSSKAGLLGRAAAKMAGVPVIVHTVHGWGFHDRMWAPYRWLFIRLERWAAAISDKLIVVSSVLKETGLREGIGKPDQYVTIYSGIDLGEFDRPGFDTAKKKRELGLPAGVPIVGTVGRLSPQKNPEDLLAAALQVVRQMPEVRFMIVGDGPLRSRVEELIRATGISRNILLTGIRHDIPELMAVLDVFVLSSLWEGLPRAIPQAMAAGKPVVCTNVDGNAEAVTHGVNGLLVPPKDPDALADALLQLLQNPGLTARMGHEGRKRAAIFTAEKMVKDIEGLYQRLLTEGAVQAVADGA
jgi:glycosyltransferase involved in cell wall biosynthesis